MKHVIPSIIGIVLSGAAAICQAGAPVDANEYLTSCLPLAEVKNLTGLPLTAVSEVSAPQRSCSYNDSETLRKQSRVLYGRDPGYKKPFGESDIMQSVSGLGRFAEYDSDGGQLYINLGNDGLVFEARQGKARLPLDRLKALAERVLSK